MTEGLKPVPAGYTSVTPWIITSDTAKLIDFVIAAFGGTEISRMADAEGRIVHAEMRIGDAVVMAFDTPTGRPGTPTFLRLFVADAQATFGRALKAGATEVTRVTPLAFGDAVGRVRDPLGYIWWLQQRLEVVSAEEMQKRWSDPTWGKAMAYVQDSLTHAMG